MVKYTEAIRLLLPMHCLSVFYHFVELVELLSVETLPTESFYVETNLRKKKMVSFLFL